MLQRYGFSPVKEQAKRGREKKREKNPTLLESSSEKEQRLDGTVK